MAIVIHHGSQLVGGTESSRTGLTAVTCLLVICLTCMVKPPLVVLVCVEYTPTLTNYVGSKFNIIVATGTSSSYTTVGVYSTQTSTTKGFTKQVRQITSKQVTAVSPVLDDSAPPTS